MRSLVALAASALLVSNARPAMAAERAFAVTWQAPSDCPDAGALERYVDQVVGEAGAGPSSVRASGSVQRSAEGRYTATLRLDTGGERPSTRSLDAASCEAVSEAAALLIALAVRAHAAPLAPEAPKPPPPEPKPSELETVVPPQAAAPHAARGFLAFGPSLDVGSTPRATWGVSVGGGLSWPGLRVEPSVAYYVSQAETVGGRGSLGADFSLASAGARVCTPLGSRLWVAPCLGGGVDWLRGVGFGARVPHTGTSFSAIARAAALVGWDISSIISVRAELEGVLPVTRPEFEIDGAGAVFRRSPLSARAGLGIDVHF